MKKLFIFSLFLLCNNFMFAQDKTYKVKLYNNSNYSSNTTRVSNNLNFKSINFSLFNFMPAFSIQKNKNEHEIVINSIGKSKGIYYSDYMDSNNIKTNKTIANSFICKLNYIYHFPIKKLSNKTNLYLGLNAEPSFYSSSFKPNIGNSFETNIKNFFFNFYLQPRITYKLTDRLDFEFNLPLNILELGVLTNKVKNPAISPQQQKTTTMDLNIAPNYFQLNFGLALKI